MIEKTQDSAAGEVAASILAHPAIDDCYVWERESALVAYIVANRRVTPDEINRELLAQAPGSPTPDVYVPVSAIPLTRTSEVDLDALGAVPVLDRDLVAAAEEQAGGTAVFVVEEDPSHRPPLHLADLLPDWKRGGSTPQATSAAPVANKAAAAGKRPPAIREGEPLRAAIPRNLAAALRRAVNESGGQGVVYLQHDGQEIFQSYADLLADAERILRSLRELGAQPTDRFLFQFRHNQDFLPAFWACVLGGFVPVPISIAPTYEQPNATTSKLYNAWEMLGKPWILSDEALLPSIRGLSGQFDFEGMRAAAIEGLRQSERDSNWHDSEPGDLALLLFTSGSTGQPKAVRQCHSALLNRSAATSQMTNLSSADIFLNWMPLDHVGGIVMFHLPGVFLGARQLHAPTQMILQNPLLWLDIIERHRVTNTWAPNFAYGLVNGQAEEIAKRKWDLSSLVFILNAGEAIVARTIRRFLDLLIPHGLPPTAMRPSWGMSETCSAVTYSDRFTLDRTRDSDLFVEVGEPAPEFAMRIVDNDSAVIDEGAIGRLQVKGPSVLTGYLQNPAANQESFTADGWFNTGDLGRIEDGQLTITGRQKDVIIVNGVNFYSHELEAVAEEVPGLALSFTAVCAVREEGADTDSIAVFFSPLAGSDTRLASLIGEIRGALVRKAGVNPTYLIPVQKEQIPKTEIGKIQRAALRKRLTDGEFDEVLKRVDILTRSGNTIPDWFFEKVWQRRNLDTVARDVGPKRWVVFCDAEGVGHALSKRLQASGQRVIEVEARGSFDRTDGGAVDCVVHLCTYAGGAGDSPAGGEGRRIACPTWPTLADQQASVMQLLEVVKELGDSTVEMYVVSTRSQFVVPGDTPCYEAAALPAIVRTIAIEQPQLRCRHIDLEPGDATANATRLLDEITSASFDTEVAWREGSRFVPRLHRSGFRAAGKAAAEFVTGGAYLLAGGLGGIGAEIARFLLTRHQARVLVAGRTARAALSAEALQTLEGLEALGDISYAAIDIADSAAVEETVAAAEREWGRPLDGILHLAAVYHDGLLAAETPETLASAFHAKVMGAWALQQLLEARPQALFVGFSSVLSFFPGALVGAYAAANRVLENFALSLHALGYRAYACAWGGWRETGMSRGQSTREALRAKGILEMSTEQGWNSMLVALAAGSPLTFAGLDPDNLAIRRVSAGEPCALLRLSAFYLSGDESGRDRLRAIRLFDRFGAPAPFQCDGIDEIPRMPAGAIDRNALSAAVRRLRRGATRYAEPATEMERRICTVWQEVLDAPHMGVEDNFFSFGGHSLLATRVLARLRSLFGVEIPLRSLFDTPTVRGFAASVEKLTRTGAAATVTVRRVEDRSELPLSFTQQRLWFLDQWQPGSPVYNIPLVFRVAGALDFGILQHSLDAVVERHECLRTTFHGSGGQPVQKTTPNAQVPLRRIDLRDRQGSAEAEAQRLAIEEVRRPFDLSCDVLLRATLFQLGDDDFLLAFAMHHIAADGWSLDILFRELSDCYEAVQKGADPALDPLGIQFADYAVWQREYLEGAVLDEQLGYWRKQLAGAPPLLKLPTDLPRPATQRFRGALHLFEVPQDLADIVREICRVEQVTPFIALLTVLQIVLRQYSGQNDISVGSPIANRTNLETEGLIGFFANTLVFRTVFSADPTFQEALAAVRETALGAYSHQHMPFERLVEILKPPRAGHNPLFQVNFRVVTAPPATLRFGPVTAARVPLDPGTARFDLALELLFTEERFEGYFEYSTDLFYPATIRRMQSDFELILRTLAKQPGVPLSQLGLDRLTAAVPDRRGGAIRRRSR